MGGYPIAVLKRGQILILKQPQWVPHGGIPYCGIETFKAEVIDHSPLPAAWGDTLLRY